MKYKLSGTYRKLSTSESTEGFVHTIEAKTPRIAMDHIRGGMYRDGCDHILFTRVEVKSGDDWQTIPMTEALGLE